MIQPSTGEGGGGGGGGQWYNHPLRGGGGGGGGVDVGKYQRGVAFEQVLLYLLYCV